MCRSWTFNLVLFKDSLKTAPFMHLFPLASLLLSQMDVQDSTDEKQRDAQPRQDDAEAKASIAWISGVA